MDDSTRFITDDKYSSFVGLLKKGYEILKTDGGYNKKKFIPLRGKQPSFNLFEFDENDRTLFNVSSEEDAKTIEVTEQDLSSFATELSVQYGFETSGKVLKTTATNSIAVGVGFATEEEQKSFYTFRDERYVIGYIDFDVQKAKNLLTPDAKETLEGVKDSPSAYQAITKYGIGYINQITFGGKFQMSCRMKRSHHMKQGELESSFKNQISVHKTKSRSNAGAELNIEFSFESRGHSNSSTITSNAFGGKSTELPDYFKWRDSVREYPDIIAYDVEPIYSLVNSPDAFKFLSEAYNEILDKYPPLPTFNSNFGREIYYIDVTHDENYWGKTEKADITIRYENDPRRETITLDREAFLTGYGNWRGRVRKEGSKFAEGNESNVKFTSETPIKNASDVPNDTF